MTRGIIDQTSDVDLLNAHIAGDGNAFRELYERHRHRMWAIALRTTGNQDDAADALQDAWISIHRTARSYRADASVSSWLYKIVVNSCLDRLRRIRCHETVPLIELESSILADEHDYTDDIDVSLSIGRALDVLPPDQRDAVVLVDLHGYSIRDAAAALDIACGTVKSRCSRGREKLALVLAYMRHDD
ncbi:MAG: RNA polymerase sigma factor SigM [Gordonia sp. (in: high G+C Gram-positive bacteria)]|uniref:RNA polymerase sigma factor SigM n=1 Tax=Gordonia sp. (in: high G+C Gram-positive bacteria) TaxID=84139 RepID=UPI003C792A5D